MQQEITTRTWRKVLEEASKHYDSDVEYQGKQYTTFYSDDTLDGDYPCAYVFSHDPQDDKLYKVDYEWTGDKDADEATDWVADWTTDVHSMEQLTDDADDTVEFLNDNSFWQHGAVYY